MTIKAEHVPGKPDTFTIVKPMTVGAVVADKNKRAPDQPRALHTIAAEIRATWKRKDGTSSINYAAKPYLDAMSQLSGIDDMYILDSAASVVRYFLANASSYRGDDAKRIKAELKALLKRPEASRT